MKVKPRMIAKICIDIAMTISLLLLMPYQLIGEKPHEYIGIVMFILFIIHHILNRAWSKNILKGKYNARRITQSLLVLLILLCMLGSMISGIIISRYAFVSLNIQNGAATARSMHMLCAYWGFIFMSLHLGFHWNMMIAMAKNTFPPIKGKSVMVARVIAVVIAVYGVAAFIKRDIWNYITLKNHFAFFDFSEPVIFFILDYLAIMGLFVFIGHYLSKGLIRLQKNVR